MNEFNASIVPSLPEFSIGPVMAAVWFRGHKISNQKQITSLNLQLRVHFPNNYVIFGNNKLKKKKLLVGCWC